MIRHLFIAALRNMAANKLISAISILGLAVGTAVAVLAALVIRNQLSFDHFIPGHERIYGLVNDDPLANNRPNNSIRRVAFTWDLHDTTAFLDQKIPQIEESTRLYLTGAHPEEALSRLRHGSVDAEEQIYWADPNVFDLLPLPVLYGDLSAALRRPEGIVLSRSAAEKYFGRDDVLGQVIFLDGHPMVVQAVIRDLPAQGTTLQAGIFASSLSQYSALLPVGMIVPSPEARARTNFALAIVYRKLKPGADPTAVAKRISELEMTRPSNQNVYIPYRLLPLDRLNLFEALNPGIRARLTIVAAIGAAVLLIAALNFVSLMTVIAARREKEIGVRKACGAGRKALFGQFLGEAVIAVFLGVAIAMALDEWLLPPLNAFLQTGARLDFSNEPLLVPALLLSIVGLGLAAGAYPAFLLSAFRPTTVLRGWTSSEDIKGTHVARSALVSVQFSILVALGICTLVVWQQHQFATRKAMRVDTEQVLLIRTTAPRSPKPPFLNIPNMEDPRACPAAMLSGLRALPGVRMAMCSSDFMQQGAGIGWYASAHTVTGVSVIQTDPAIFSLYGIKAVAGNLASAGSGVVLNMSAVKLLGFASPQDAIGKTWMKPKGARDMWSPRFNSPGPTNPRSWVVAVVPDFGFQPVSQPTDPYVISPWMMGGLKRMIQVKLDGERIPETLAAIDRLWRQTGQMGTADRLFLNDYMQQQYLDLERQAQLFSLVSALAIFMACLGLVGIAVSTAERQAKEIGVRKAMGARNRQIVTLLLWQFSRPVLFANLIAWPVAWWLMRRWLSDFVYHIDLHWWVFAAASFGALLIALLTVAGQAWIAARGKPVQALRYE